MRILAINTIMALLLVATSVFKVAADDGVPNFNYPQTVIKDANKSLNKALKKGNHADVIKYLIQSTIAEAQISSDNIPGILQKIDSVAALETDSAAIATMHYLKAVVYSSYFSNNAYAISQRKPTDGTRAADMSEWCKDDFITAITESLTQSLSYSNALWNTPIDEYVETDKLSAAIYPTMLDMVTYRGIDLLDQVIAYRGTSARSNATKRAKQLEHDALQMLIDRHSGNAAPYIAASLERISNGKPQEIRETSRSLYEEYKNDEFCYPALETYLNLIDDDKQRYSLLNEYLQQFPGSPFAPDARNYIARLSQKQVQLHYSSTFTSADTVTVKVESRNVNSCRILVYRVPDNANVNSKLVANRSSLQLVAETIATMEGETPFADTTVVTMKPLPYGRYIVVPDYDGILAAPANIYPQEFRVSDISLFHTKSSNGVKVFAVNTVTGEPIEGVYINRVTRNDIAQTSRIAANRTNADGYALIKHGDSRLQERVAPAKGNDRYGMPAYVSEFNLYEPEPANIEVLTDLGVYHPGDTVRFVAICYNIDRNGKRIESNLPVTATLYDTNYDELASDSLATDEFGRVSGAFVIPTDRMNGRFNITIDSHNASGIANFPVSEYKAPTFTVLFDGDQHSYAQGTDITLTGRAEYFTGIPVAGAQVAIDLGYQSWNWWYRFIGSNSTHIDQFTTTTDSNGQFTITIPDSLLHSDDLPQRVQFSIEAAITDAAGETQSASKLFWLGNTRTIEMTGGNYTFEVSNGSTRLPINVRSSNAADTLLTCNYALTGKATANGQFTSTKPVIDFSSLPSGQYDLKVTIDGDTATQPLETEIIIYRQTDNVPPIASPLWIPDGQLSISDSNEASMLIGNSCDTAHIYCIAASAKGIVKESWLKYGKGMHRFTIDIPQAEDEYIDITFITINNKVAYTWNHRFESVMHRDTLRIMPIAFRDNLTPGMPETWTFKLVNQDGQLRHGALICDMYDKALDMIAAHEWNFAPTYRQGMLFGYNTPYIFPIGIYTNISPKYEKTTGAQLPDLDFYGRNYAGRIYIMGAASSRLMATKAAPQLDAGGITTNEVFAMAEEEVASTDELQQVVVVENHADGGDTALDNVQLRTANVQNALWRPSLMTDDEGNVSVTFQSPLFNTTWLFKAIAYTHDLHTASIVREVVTRKPIMVRASLPRFVRNGDVATLSSMLMNATDSAQSCTAVVELFDIATGDIFMSQQFSATLEAKGSTALDIQWTVPADISLVGYRVKAATAEFGDGEQHLLPILPSASPVIETSPFYLYDNMIYELSTDDKEQLGGRIVLEFCNNPVWYCVTALPSIMQDDYTTASGLAHSIYAIAVAQGIANGNPQIQPAIDQWLANESDSTLVSNLAKNGDLKIGTLLASPWLNEAERQTARMQSIGMLFDSTAVSAEMQEIITKLRELQMGDGGWTWFRYSGCTSSQYVTMQVLQLIGEVQHLGFMTDNIDINAMTAKAVAYLDFYATEDYSRLKDKSDLSSFYGYAYVRSLFPGIDFTGNAQNVFKATLKCMKSRWDAATGLSDKAWCAMTLFRNGEKKTASKIMESVLQYAIPSHNGLYWDNFKNGSDRNAGRVAVTATLLQAFGEICASDTETIDSIRQWLLLQKQSTDWGNSSLAADAVYAILSTGSQWLDTQADPDITLNGKPMEYDPTDMLTGYFRKSIEPADGKLDLHIDRRNAASPAWGAVYFQYSAKMDGIKAAKIDDLSIEKQLCRFDGDQLDSKASLAVGDKVIVKLVIKNARDLQFVTINDERAACCEPTDQLSGYRFADGLGYYLEIKDSATKLFFNYLPKGTHVITYEMTITSTGSYNMGIATIQSQYAPQITAHSSGSTTTVK